MRFYEFPSSVYEDRKGFLNHQQKFADEKRILLDIEEKIRAALESELQITFFYGERFWYHVEGVCCVAEISFWPSARMHLSLKAGKSHISSKRIGWWFPWANWMSQYPGVHEIALKVHQVVISILLNAQLDLIECMLPGYYAKPLSHLIERFGASISISRACQGSLDVYRAVAASDFSLGGYGEGICLREDGSFFAWPSRRPKTKAEREMYFAGCSLLEKHGYLCK